MEIDENLYLIIEDRDDMLPNIELFQNLKKAKSAFDIKMELAKKSKFEEDKLKYLELVACKPIWQWRPKMGF